MSATTPPSPLTLAELSTILRDSTQESLLDLVSQQSFKTQLRSLITTANHLGQALKETDFNLKVQAFLLTDTMREILARTLSSSEHFPNAWVHLRRLENRLALFLWVEELRIHSVSPFDLDHDSLEGIFQALITERFTPSMISQFLSTHWGAIAQRLAPNSTIHNFIIHAQRLTILTQASTFQLMILLHQLIYAFNHPDPERIELQKISTVAQKAIRQLSTLNDANHSLIELEIHKVHAKKNLALIACLGSLILLIGLCVLMKNFNQTSGLIASSLICGILSVLLAFIGLRYRSKEQALEVKLAPQKQAVSALNQELHFYFTERLARRSTDSPPQLTFKKLLERKAEMRAHSLESLV